MMSITTLYAGILGLMYLVLTLRIVRMRRTERALIGPGESDGMLRSIRAHGNFAEYVPLGLILIGLLEAQKGAPLLLHALGFLLLAGRISHAYSLLRHEPKTLGAQKLSVKFRVLGMVCTFTVFTVASLALLYSALLA